MEVELTIQGRTYPIERREARGLRRASAWISMGGKIVVAIPASFEREDAAHAYNSLIRRIEKRIASGKSALRIEKSEIRFADEQEITVLGKTFRISISESDRRTAAGRLDGNEVQVLLPKEIGSEAPGIASRIARKVISAAVLPEVRDRVDAINSVHFKSQINKVRIKDNIGNWGSCSHKNNINFDFRLLLAPAEVFDAIIAHELAHTKHRNHSEKFWGLMKEVSPNYKKMRIWLKENGARLAPGKMISLHDVQMTPVADHVSEAN
jgi:hypothetical protein